jgi:hypothetical protein
MPGETNPNAVTDRDAKELIGEMMLRQIELSKTISSLRAEMQMLQAENKDLREQLNSSLGQPGKE